MVHLSSGIFTDAGKEGCKSVAKWAPQLKRENNRKYSVRHLIYQRS